MAQLREMLSNLRSLEVDCHIVSYADRRSDLRLRCALWRGDVIVKATTMLGMEHLFASIAGLQEIGSS